MNLDNSKMDTRNRLVKMAWLTLLLAGGPAFFWLVVARIAARFHGDEPCPFALAWLVDNPPRRWYMGWVLDRISIRAGECVLELGTGLGAFSVEAARRADPGGVLVTVGIQPRMIAAVEEKTRKAGVSNVETYVANANDLPLEDRSVDRAFLVTVLPEIPDQHQALLELGRVLKPGGVLSITEEFLDPDYPLARTSIRRAREAGLELTARHGNWLVDTLNFRKPAWREVASVYCKGPE